MRPIISYTNSLLSNSAKFVDHVLQPLTQSYEDYIQTSFTNFTATHFLGNTSLATVSVETIFLPILQSEVLDLLYNELYAKWELLQFEWKLLTRVHRANATGAASIAMAIQAFEGEFFLSFGNKTTKNMFQVKKKQKQIVNM